MPTIAELRKIVDEVGPKLMSLPNMVGVSIGFKVKDGVTTDEWCIVCSVSEKKDVVYLTSDQMIPRTINDAKTDVVETGEFKALADQARYRPAPCGVSIGHYQITAGTLGCLVRSSDGKVYILSNNHVLAKSNDANINDPILQPGVYDGGQVGADTIAMLTKYVRIYWEGEKTTRCWPFVAIAGLLNPLAKMIGSYNRLEVIIEATSNLVDAAIAEPLPPYMNYVDSLIRDIGKPTGISSSVSPGMVVKKRGRTTLLTQGNVTSIYGTVRVNYGANKVALFKDQILTTNMSEGGDSGSALLNSNNQVVGLLFAGSSTQTIHNRIHNVFSALGLAGVA